MVLLKADLIYEGRKYMPEILPRELEKESGLGDIIRLATIPRNNIEVYFAETSAQALARMFRDFVSRDREDERATG